MLPRRELDSAAWSRRPFRVLARLSAHAPAARGACGPAVGPSARLGLVRLSAFLLVFPPPLGQPGAPTHLKADEAAYFGMALSLAHDGELRFDGGDGDRFFTEFPVSPVE